MDNILRERRLRWLDMFCVWIISAYHSSTVLAPGYKKGSGRRSANWRSTVDKDLKKMGITWKEAEVAALDRQRWRRSVAQCVQLDAERATVIRSGEIRRRTLKSSEIAPNFARFGPYFLGRPFPPKVWTGIIKFSLVQTTVQNFAPIGRRRSEIPWRKR